MAKEKRVEGWGSYGVANSHPMTVVVQLEFQGKVMNLGFASSAFSSIADWKFDHLICC